MKRTLTIFSIVASMLFVSCEKTAEVVNRTTPPAVDAEGREVTVSFDGTTVDITRNILDSNAQGYAHEQKINTLTCYIVKDENIITERKFTTEEVTALTATFSIPNFTKNTPYKIYVIANEYYEPKNESEIKALMATDISSYNGTFAELTTKSKRVKGFQMSGVTTVNSTDDKPISIEITLERLVSKMAIQMSTSTKFAARYKGVLRFDKISISKGSSKSPAIIGTKDTSVTFTHEQLSVTSAGKGENLFYIFENGSRTADDNLLLTVTTTYDADKNFLTTADQQQVVYTLPITESNGGINRNSFYRRTITFNGFSGEEVDTQIKVADWNIIATVDNEVGN